MYGQWIKKIKTVILLADLLIGKMCPKAQEIVFGSQCVTPSERKNQSVGWTLLICQPAFFLQHTILTSGE